MHLPRHNSVTKRRAFDDLAVFIGSEIEEEKERREGNGQRGEKMLLDKEEEYE